MLGIVVALTVASVAGAVLWWPRGDAPDLYGGNPPSYVEATVTDAREGDCAGLEFEVLVPCQQLTARLTSGPDVGGDAEFITYATEGTPTIAVDDRVVLTTFDGPNRELSYSFSDFDRETSLIGFGLAFVVVVALFGRWHGLRALVGLAISLYLLLQFLVPSLLEGNPPLGVALTGGLLITGVAIYVAHGASITTTVALVGSITSVLVIALLAAVAVEVAQLTGLDQGAAQTLRITAEGVNLRGLLVAGIVVGALGVLDDVTVTQVSAVAELRRANPELRGLPLYRAAVRIGRDHVAAVVNTLVLAYAGASLPLLLLFSQGSTPLNRAVTSQLVATEVIRTVVGSIGLVLAVPVTTALAALVVAPQELATPTTAVSVPT